MHDSYRKSVGYEVRIGQIHYAAKISPSKLSSSAEIPPSKISYLSEMLGRGLPDVLYIYIYIYIHDSCSPSYFERSNDNAPKPDPHNSRKNIKEERVSKCYIIANQ